MVTTNAVRFPLANLFAFALMGALFAFLYTATTRQVVILDPPRVRPVIFDPVIHETPIPARTPKAVPPRVLPPPVVPPIDQRVPGPGDGVPVGPRPVDPVEPTPFSHGVINRTATPMVRPDPVYPYRAVTAGIEGWVELQFTITAAGTVTDVAIIDAEPVGVFEEAAKKALLRWKYAPSVDDGRAIERRGMRVVLRFDVP